MKAAYIAIMAAAGVVVAGQAHADEALAKAKNCMTCHAVDKKLVGPAYKEVAAKYKGDKAAVATLAAKIKAGGFEGKFDRAAEIFTQMSTQDAFEEFLTLPLYEEI